MSTDTKQLEFDSKKYVALVYDAGGAFYNWFESDSQEEIVRDATNARSQCVAEAKPELKHLPICEFYTRNREVEKLVEEAYAKGLADGKAGQ